MYSLLSTLALAATVQGVAHNIAVGRGGALRFDPADITAAVGDTLVFHFYDTSGPHNVVSGNFDDPCKPKSGAFYSGTMEGDDDGEDAFVVQVTSTDPIYFYCSINRHCQSGMVGAVNAPSGQGSTQYLQGARRATGAEAPSAVAGGTTTEIDNIRGSTTSIPSTGSSGTTLTGTVTSSSSSTRTTGTTSGTGTATTTNLISSITSSLANAATSGSRTSSAPTPSTTPNTAGRHSMGVVLGGVAAVLGGFVALMA